MTGLFRKVILKLKLILRPKAFSRIKRGYGTGLYWTHEVSDMRYLLGEYEPELAAWLKEKMQKGYSFIDIGANAGYFSLLATKFLINDSQRILAFEPMPENIRQLTNHRDKNSASKIEIYPLAVADTDRVVEFSDSTNHAANTYNEASVLHRNSPKIPIQAKSLDSICNDSGLTSFVVKIDVEGAELDVLKGGVETLSKFKPELILATHDCHVKGIEKACLDFLSGLGYTCTPVADEKFVGGQQDYLCRHTSKVDQA